jgi:hypothetical protein
MKGLKLTNSDTIQNNRAIFPHPATLINYQVLAIDGNPLLSLCKSMNGAFEGIYLRYTSYHWSDETHEDEILQVIIRISEERLAALLKGEISIGAVFVNPEDKWALFFYEKSQDYEFLGGFFDGPVMMEEKTHIITRMPMHRDLVPVS